MRLTVDVFEYPGRIEQCFDVRRRVFIDEQDVTEEEEIDGLDPDCLHFLALLDGIHAGAARLRDGVDGVAKAERVCVLREHRRKRVGHALMAAFEKTATERGYQQVLLGAQLQAIPFYKSLGYIAEGDEYLDARIRHRWMRRWLLGGSAA